MSRIDSLRDEWEALQEADTLTMLPKKALVASIKDLTRHLLYVTSPECMRTRTGRIIFEEDIQAWADEAEAGYDVTQINARSRGVRVPVNLVEDIVSWWRAANEAPGGCSPRDAIDGMRDAVWALETARREQTGTQS
jgi:hypothetical protein